MKVLLLPALLAAALTYTGMSDAEMSDKGTASAPLAAHSALELHFSLARHQGASFFANVEKAAMHDKLAVLTCVISGDEVHPFLSQGPRCGLYLGDSRQATYTLTIVNQDNVDHVVTLTWRKVAPR